MFGILSGKSCPDGFEYYKTIDNDTVMIYKDGDGFKKNTFIKSKECISTKEGEIRRRKENGEFINFDGISIKQTQEGNIYYIQKVLPGGSWGDKFFKAEYTKEFFDTNLDGRYENVYIKYNNFHNNLVYFCTIENLMPVYGTVNGKNGTYVYEGPFKNWYPDGKGIEMKKTENPSIISKYEGEFKEGKYEGIGELYENGKIKYKGQFHSGKFWGTGELFYENGKLKYKGQFNENQFGGTEIIEQQNLNMKVRAARPGIGTGELFYENGKLKYKGGFLQDFFHGSGELYDENGKLKYKGQFEKGSFNDKGIEYNEDGTIKSEGYYKDGELFTGKGTCDINLSRKIFDLYKWEYINLVMKKFIGTKKNGMYVSGEMYDEEGMLKYSGTFFTRIIKEEYPTIGYFSEGTVYSKYPLIQYKGSFQLEYDYDKFAFNVITFNLYYEKGEFYHDGKLYMKGTFKATLDTDRLFKVLDKLYNGTVYEPHYHYDVEDYKQKGTWIVDDGFKKCKDERYPYKSIVGRIDPSKDDCLRENGRIVTEGKRINKKKRKSKFQKHKSKKRGVNCSKKK